MTDEQPLRFVSAKEALKLLPGESHFTLRARARKGELPYVRTPGGKFRYAARAYADRQKRQQEDCLDD